MSVFQVPPAKASIKQNVFEFSMPGDDTVYSLPKLQFIKPWLVAKLDGGKKTDIIGGLLDEYHPELFRKIEDSDQLVALYEGWAESSGIKLGESSASPASPEASTAGPSAEISTSSDVPSTTSEPPVSAG